MIFLEVIAFGDEKYGVVARKAGKKNTKSDKIQTEKTIKQQVYCEMCPQMVSNKRNVMDDRTWQENGARAHKGRVSDQFL